MDDGSDQVVHQAPDNEFLADLDNWLNSSWGDCVVKSGMNFGEGATTTNPNSPSQPLIPIIQAGTNFGGSSSNASQFGMAQEMMTTSSLAPSNSADTLDCSGQILSSAVESLAQSSQSHATTDFTHSHQLQPTQAHQNQPLLPQGPMVNTHSLNLHNSQILSQQMQQNMNQNQLQLQQVTGTSCNLISVAEQQKRINAHVILSAPVGFATPGEFSSSAAFREYVLRQIPKMKERYYNDILKNHSNVIQLHAMATTEGALIKYRNIKTYMERMMRFLNISTVDSIPQNDHSVYNCMNIIVNFVNYQTRDKPGGSSQHSEPVHQSPKGLGSSVQLLNPRHNIKPRKIRAGMSPLIISSSVNQCPSHQSSLPSTMNPVSQQTSLFSSNFDVNKVLSLESIAKSPFLLSPTPSGVASLTTAENQKNTTCVGLPSQEPQKSKDDGVHHLTGVVKPISSNALTMVDIIHECIPTNLLGQYDNQQHPMENDQFDCQELDMHSIETYNKRQKTDVTHGDP